MSRKFIQVSATKPNGDFAFCSNLSLMGNDGLSYNDALLSLNLMADEYSLMGYTVERIVEPMSDEDWAIYEL